VNHEYDDTDTTNSARLVDLDAARPILERVKCGEWSPEQAEVYAQFAWGLPPSAAAKRSCARAPKMSMTDRQLRLYLAVEAIECVLSFPEYQTEKYTAQLVETRARARRAGVRCRNSEYVEWARERVAHAAHERIRERRPATAALRARVRERRTTAQRGPPDGDSDDPDPPYVRPLTAAGLLGVPRRTFYDQLRAGKIPRVQRGGGRVRPRYLIPLAWVREQERGGRDG
jgi:hypothetical protein